MSSLALATSPFFPNEVFGSDAAEPGPQVGLEWIAAFSLVEGPQQFAVHIAVEPLAGGKTYVTVCTILERALGPGEPPTGASAHH